MRQRKLFLMVVGTFILMGLLSQAQAAAREWETLKGRNFIVYFRKEVPESFVKTVLESAQDDFSNVSENLGISRYQSWNQNPASIYVYRDAQDYTDNGGASWSHGASLIGSKTIKTYPSDEGFFDSLLPHELGHIVLHEHVGPYANVPLWFDEGVAMYQEKARSIGRQKIVLEALQKGEFIALSQLTDMRLYTNTERKTVELFYAESASIVNFIISQLGEGHFHKLCSELKQGTPFVDAIPKIYMNIKDLDGLNKKWVNYLKEES